MRAFVDIVDSIFGTIRYGITALLFFGLAMSLMVTACVAYVAPDFEQERAEQARLDELAIQESREAKADALRSRREAELAKDGWGYEAQ